MLSVSSLTISRLIVSWLILNLLTICELTVSQLLVSQLIVSRLTVSEYLVNMLTRQPPGESRQVPGESSRSFAETGAGGIWNEADGVGIPARSPIVSQSPIDFSFFGLVTDPQFSAPFRREKVWQIT